MCDTVVRVHADRVLFAKNSDRDPNEAQLVTWEPRREAAPGSEVRCTHRSVPEAPRTYATLLCRPFWMWGAEMGANEHGVVIGNEAVFTREPLEPGGLTGMDLLRLALERAATADDAVQVVVSLLEMHGQGGGAGYEDLSFTYSSSFLVADARGAWVLETAGRRHAVERVREGARSISNGLTIGSFARAHGDPIRTHFARAARRAARTRCLAVEAQDARDMFRVLRDHGEGRRWPRYRAFDGGLGAPCMHAGGLLLSSQTVGSLVSELGPSGARHFGTGASAPCVALFQPLDAPTAGQGSRVLGPAPASSDDRETHWWRWEAVNRRLLQDPERLASGWLTRRDALEARLGADPADASRVAEDALASLERELAGARSGDTRPPWARRYWAARDAEARA